MKQVTHAPPVRKSKTSARQVQYKRKSAKPRKAFHPAPPPTPKKKPSHETFVCWKDDWRWVFVYSDLYQWYQHHKLTYKDFPRVVIKDMREASDTHITITDVNGRSEQVPRENIIFYKNKKVYDLWGISYDK